MATAEGLVDYKVAKTDTADVITKPNSKGFKKGKKKNGDGDKNKQPQSNNEMQGKPAKVDFGCFICKEPHRVQDSPKKENLNAMDVNDETIRVETSRVNPF